MQMLMGMLGQPKEESTILPEAQVMQLQELCAAYQTQIGVGCPYNIGDLVTPKSNTNMRAAGDPHIVLEVFHRAGPCFNHGDPGDAGFGERHDMRVAVFYGEKIYPFWVESHKFAPYQLPTT